jgi:hypothetical protein
LTSEKEPSIAFALASAAVMVFAAAASQAACIPLLPLQLADAGMGYFGIGFTMAASTLGAIGFRLGARNYLNAMSVGWWMRIGLLAIAAALAGYATLAPDFRFGLFRFMQGAGFGAVSIAAMVWAAQRSSARERSLVFAVIGGAIGLGIISGPPFVVALKTTRSLPLAYLLTALVALAACLAPFGRVDRIQLRAKKGAPLGGAAIAGAFVCILTGAAIGIMEAFAPIVVARDHVSGLPVIISVFGFASVAGRFIPSAIGRNLSMRSVVAVTIMASALCLVVTIWSMRSTIPAIAGVAMLGASLGAATNAAITWASLATDHADQASMMALLGIAADLGLGLGAVIGGGSMTTTGDWGMGLAAIASGLAIAGIAVARRSERPLGKSLALGDGA